MNLKACFLVLGVEAIAVAVSLYSLLMWGPAHYRRPYPLSVCPKLQVLARLLLLLILAVLVAIRTNKRVKKLLSKTKIAISITRMVLFRRCLLYTSDAADE